MIKVNKRQYERPAMRVVALQQRHHLDEGGSPPAAASSARHEWRDFWVSEVE